MKKIFLLSLMFGAAFSATQNNDVNAEEVNEQVDNFQPVDWLFVSFPSTIDVSTVGRGTCSEEAKDIQVTFDTFTPGDELSGDLAQAPFPPAPVPFFKTNVPGGDPEPFPVRNDVDVNPFIQAQAPMPPAPLPFAEVQLPFPPAPLPFFKSNFPGGEPVPFPVRNDINVNPFDQAQAPLHPAPLPFEQVQQPFPPSPMPVNGLKQEAENKKYKLNKVPFIDGSSIVSAVYSDGTRELIPYVNYSNIDDYSAEKDANILDDLTKFIYFCDECRYMNQRKDYEISTIGDLSSIGEGLDAAEQDLFGIVKWADCKRYFVGEPGLYYLVELGNPTLLDKAIEKCKNLRHCFSDAGQDGPKSNGNIMHALVRIAYPVHACDIFETLRDYLGDDCVEKMLKEKDKLNKETPIELMDDIIQMSKSHKELYLNPSRDKLLNKLKYKMNRFLIEREQERNNNNQNQN